MCLGSTLSYSWSLKYFILFKKKEQEEMGDGQLPFTGWLLIGSNVVKLMNLFVI